MIAQPKVAFKGIVYGALPQTPQETEFLDFQLDATARCGKTFQMRVVQGATSILRARTKTYATEKHGVATQKYEAFQTFFNFFK